MGHMLKITSIQSYLFALHWAPLTRLNRPVVLPSVHPAPSSSPGAGWGEVSSGLPPGQKVP